MPFIAAAASWGEDPSLGARVRAMTMALSSWAPDGIESVSHPWFSGAFGRLTTNAAQTQGAFRDDDAGLIVLGDTRLDNANDLSRAPSGSLRAGRAGFLDRSRRTT